MSIFEELRPLSVTDRRLRVAVLGCTRSVLAHPPSPSSVRFPTSTAW